MAFSISHLIPSSTSLNLTPLSLNPKTSISPLPPPHLHLLRHSREKPYLVARVAYLEDRPSSSHSNVNVNDLANEVETYMKDVIRLSNRLAGKDEKDGVDWRRNLVFPTPFSFFVGSTFEGAPREQQALLELENTTARLLKEKEILKKMLDYLSAAAVKDIFS